jgi:TetR/AcrR family transcriptional regulator, cholesterol catabolism regulator
MPDPKGSDVKETIIRESTRLFVANGFRGTSVKDITEAAGIARGTLYWYFKAKEDILESIFEKFEEEFIGGLTKVVDNCEGDFIAKYRAFHKYATEFARDNTDLSLAFNVLLNEVVGTNTRLEKVVKAVYGKYHRLLQDMLEAGKKDGSVKESVDPALYAHVVMAAHAGMLVEWFVNGDSFDVGAFVRTFRDFVLKGIIEQ